MSRKIMTIKPFKRYNRIIPVDSYMNVDRKLFEELVLRKRVAVSMEDYKANYGKNKKAELDKVGEIETTAERAWAQEKADNVQHVAVHHFNEEE